MSTTKRKTVFSLVPAVAAATAVMAAGVAGNVVGTYIHNTPSVGHIIAFEPAPAFVGGSAERLAVRRADGSECVLDLATIRRFGGSLVVETLSANEASDYRVHWAGKSTSEAGGDCGKDTNLTVGRGTLDVLASSAGGYGTGQDRATVFPLGIGR